MKMILLALIWVSLIGCKHCPVKETCKPYVQYVFTGKVIVPIFSQWCVCPVKEIEND